MKAYYEARAREYDDWWLGRGLYTSRVRPGWFDEVTRLLRRLASLPPRRTLDVACGTGFLTRHLHGRIIAFDQSSTMLDVARHQIPDATGFARGDALALPFRDASFERLFTAHFYGHLGDRERMQFLGEARRVAREIVVVDSAPRDGVAAEEWQDRELKDGSRWSVYKRFLSPEVLATELDGGEVLFAGQWFTAVRSPS